MINVSNEFLELMRQRTDFIPSAEITLANGTVLQVGMRDMVAGENCLVDAANADGIPIGAAICRTITLTLDNSDERYADTDFFGAEVHITLSFSMSETTETVDYGYFTVTKPEEYGASVSITAEDAMYKADRTFETTLAAPVTAGALLRDICRTCGIPLTSATFRNDDFVIENIPEREMTFRQVIGYIACIAGGNARINRFGRLEIIEYDFSYVGAYTVPLITDLQEELQTETGDDIIVLNEDVAGRTLLVLRDWINSPNFYASEVQVTGVSVTSTGNEGDSVLEGTDDYVLVVENPLSAGKEEELAQFLAALMTETSFLPFSGDHISLPIAEFMDPAAVMDWKGNVHYSFLTDISFSFFGTTTLRNSAKSGYRSGARRYQTSANTSYQRARELINNQRRDFEEEYENLEYWIQSAPGYYVTREEQQDGSVIVYEHDQPTLAESIIIWKKTGTTRSVSTDGGQTWTAGVTADGNAIMRILTVEGLNAGWINAGALNIGKTIDGEWVETFYADVPTGTVRIGADAIIFTGGGNSQTIANMISDINSDIEDAGKTASQFLFFTQANGLVISEYGTPNGRDPDDTGTTPSRDYYNVQVKGSGINFRLLSDVLMYMGINNNGDTVITMNRTPGGDKAMQLQGDGLSFYGEITDPSTNVTTNQEVAYIGTEGLDVRRGIIGDFIVTNTGAAGKSVENGGHIYASSFYCNYTGDATYNYEYGFHGNQSDKTNNNIVFYAARVPKNETWLSTNRKFLTYLWTDGKFVTTKAEIGGWIIDDSKMEANGISIRSASNRTNPITGLIENKAEILLGNFTSSQNTSRTSAFIDSKGNISGENIMGDDLSCSDDFSWDGSSSFYTYGNWFTFHACRSYIALNGAVPMSVFNVSSMGIDSGSVLVVASNGRIVKQYTSSKRYKDIDRLLIGSDIEKAYDIRVYRAKYKDNYLRTGSQREGKYIPMLIAENVEESIPEAVLYNSEGQVEDWDYRVMIPVHQQMLIDQHKHIRELEEKLNQLITLCMKGENDGR